MAAAMVESSADEMVGRWAFQTARQRVSWSAASTAESTVFLSAEEMVPYLGEKRAEQMAVLAAAERAVLRVSTMDLVWVGN